MPPWALDTCTQDERRIAFEAFDLITYLRQEQSGGKPDNEAEFNRLMKRG